MNGLYSIIRRKRRPLVAASAEMPKAETLKVEGVEPVPAVAVEPNLAAKAGTSNVSDEKITPKRKKR